MRTITVEIPDDTEAEQLIRRVAMQLHDGSGLLVFTRPPEIPPENMVMIVNQMMLYLKAQQAIAIGKS